MTLKVRTLRDWSPLELYTALVASGVEFFVNGESLDIRTNGVIVNPLAYQLICQRRRDYRAIAQEWAR